MSRRDYTILTFHAVGVPTSDTDPAEYPYWVQPDVFRETLEVLVGRRDVRLTFDDGNISDASIALPALLERGLTADFFVLAGRLGDKGSSMLMTFSVSEHPA